MRQLGGAGWGCLASELPTHGPRGTNCTRMEARASGCPGTPAAAPASWSLILARSSRSLRDAAGLAQVTVPGFLLQIPGSWHSAWRTVGAH